MFGVMQIERFLLYFFGDVLWDLKLKYFVSKSNVVWQEKGKEK